MAYCVRTNLHSHLNQQVYLRGAQSCPGYLGDRHIECAYKTGLDKQFGHSKVKSISIIQLAVVTSFGLVAGAIVIGRCPAIPAANSTAASSPENSANRRHGRGRAWFPEESGLHQRFGLDSCGRYLAESTGTPEEDGALRGAETGDEVTICAPIGGVARDQAEPAAFGSLTVVSAVQSGALIGALFTTTPSSR